MSAGPALRAGLLSRVGAAAAPALFLAAAALPAAAAEGPAFHRLIEREGIEVAVTIDPLAEPGGVLTEGDSVRVRFEVTDTNTGQPIPSLYPAGWMDRLSDRAAGGERATPDEACRARVSSLIGGSLLSRAELDLNTYYVLALNEDASISVVDPLFGFGGSKLLTTVRLGSPGADWAMSKDKDRLYVTLPEEDRVAVVETSSWQVVTYVATGPAPRRIALQPDGVYVWAAYDGGPGEGRRSGVTAISTTAMKPVARIETGAGPHDLAFSDDGRRVFVTNRGAGTVSVIDVATLEVAATVATGPAPASVAWSDLGQAAYVADDRAGTIAVIDGESLEVVARLDAEPGLGRIEFAPGGRWGFVPVPSGDSVYIVDSAGQRVVHNAHVEAGPTEIAFSRELAYISHSGSSTVLMMPLTAIGREGQPVNVVDFPGGTHPPGDNPVPTPAAGIVEAPGATAVLVANPRDGAIYFYKEGMAAPMGHFQNYGRIPRAVLVVDRSLREIEPGVYETAVELRRPGSYDLAMFLDSPRVVHCFGFEVAVDPKRAAERLGRPVVARPLRVTDAGRAGEEVSVRFHLTDPASGEPVAGLGDVRILALRAPGNWHRRIAAAESGSEPGTYGARFEPPSEGVYYAFVEVPSLDLAPNRNPHVVLRVTEAAHENGDGR